MDRNVLKKETGPIIIRSLSARRAWIEISDIDDKFGGLMVALRKESVDRNMLYDTSSLMKCQSLSARRAWIEMLEKLGTLLQM